MEYIPTSLAEVKSIIEAVNLQTLERWVYLKGDRAVCKFPFMVSRESDDELLVTPEKLILDGVDPDAEIYFTGVKNKPKKQPCYGSDHFLYFERPIKPNELQDFQLTALRCRVMERENPRPAPPEEILFPAPRRENIFRLPETGEVKIEAPAAAEKPARRYRRSPQDVLKYSKEIPIGEEWQRVYAVMYRKSRFLQLCEVWGYAGKSKKKVRCYNQGNEELVRSTGLHKATISRYLTRMKKEKIILQHKRGWPGEKCSIWELPFNLDHVFAWKRQLNRGHRKNHPGMA